MDSNNNIQYITCIELEKSMSKKEYNLMLFRRKKLFNKFDMYKFIQGRRQVDMYITGRLSGGYNMTSI